MKALPGCCFIRIHSYPFGLEQSGISSKALNFGEPENKKKYNGIEKENDLQIEIYDAQFRELDAQVGRWWQIDPVTDGYESTSPYASMYNNPLTYSDPLGDEGEVCCRDFFNAIGNAFEDVLISASGVVNGAVNTLSFGLISSDPFGMRNKLSDEKLEIYNTSTTVGKVVPLFIPGGSRTKTPSMELVPAGGGKGPVVSIKVEPKAPVVVKPLSSGAAKRNRVANQKSGEKAQNHLEGIEKKQSVEKKNAASQGTKQNKIDIGKSKQNMKTELKKIKNKQDAEDNF